jgi:hypothetical protein
MALVAIDRLAHAPNIDSLHRQAAGADVVGPHTQ